MKKKKRETIWIPRKSVIKSDFIRKCIKVGCVCLVTQSCSTLCNPMDCSPAVLSVHGIFQEEYCEQVAVSQDLPTQGLNPRVLSLLHWQKYSLPLCHLELQKAIILTEFQRSQGIRSLPDLRKHTINKPQELLYKKIPVLSLLKLNNAEVEFFNGFCCINPSQPLW